METLSQHDFPRCVIDRSKVFQKLDHLQEGDSIEMKRTFLLFGAVLVCVAAMSVESNAQRRYGRYVGVNQRQVNQQNRIYSGVKNGSLTKTEAYRLERQQSHINNVESRYRSTGGLQPWERARLSYMQGRASANIYHQKHDRQYPGVRRM